MLVEGKLAYAEWEDKRGQKQRIANVVISGWDGNIQLIPSQKTSLTESEEEQQDDDNSVSIQKTNQPLGEPANEK